MGLYSIAEEAGNESFGGAYTALDAERDAEMNAILDEAGHEVDTMSDGIVLAEAYLENVENLLDMDKAVTGAGTESFNAAAQAHYNMAKIIIGGNAADLVDGGTEAKQNYYQQAVVMVRKAWVQVKKTIMKAIAKLMGFVSFRTKKLDELYTSLDKVDASKLTIPSKHSKDDIADLVKAVPIVTGEASASDITDLIEAFKKPDSKADIETLYGNFNKVLGSIKSPWSKEFADSLDGDKDIKYVVIPFVRKAKALGIDSETGKVTYKTLEYPEVKSEALVNKLPFDGISELTKAVDDMKGGNKNFSKRVDTLFKIVDKQSKVLNTAMETYGDSDRDEDDKVTFNIVKSLYSLTPRIAFDSALSMNHGIDGAIKVVEIHIEAIKKATKDAGKKWENK